MPPKPVPKRIPKPTASYPAMPLIQNKQRFFLLSIPVEDLFPYCFVTRRLDDPAEGFQRSLSEERANAIARYLESSQGSIPTNVVVSAQPEAELTYNSGTKTIKFQRVPKAFLVLDGQHRLYGYSRTSRKLGLRVPVAIYENLSRRNEAALFIDINTTQRGVPASLLLDIKQLADREDAHETALRYLFDGMNTHPSSPLNGRLSAAEATRGKISRVTFNRGGKEFIENNVMTKLSPTKQLDLVRNYFCALEASLGDPGLLFKSVYFEAFCALFGETLRLAYTRFQNYKQNSLSLVLAPLKNVDISSLAIGGKTKLTKSAILPVLLTTVSGQVDVTDDMI